MSQTGGLLYHIKVLNGELISFPGGIPVKSTGVIARAIGVLGGTVEQAQEVAPAGAEAFIYWRRAFFIIPNLTC